MNAWVHWHWTTQLKLFHRLKASFSSTVIWRAKQRCADQRQPRQRLEPNKTTTHAPRRKNIQPKEKCPGSEHIFVGPSASMSDPLLFFSFFRTLLPSSYYWTSRGHRGRPFSPPQGSCLQLLSRIDGVQQSHWSSIFHRVLPTHALALFASQFVHKKKSQRISTSMHSGGARTHETDLYQAQG